MTSQNTILELRTINEKLKSEIGEHQSELKKLRDINEGQGRAIKEWRELNAGQISRITQLNESLQQARDTIARRDRENEELKTQMV